MTAPSLPGLPLTAKELEVLALIADGCTTPEAARRLWKSPDTVKSHLRRINIKLGTRSQANAVAVAIGRGLIPAPTTTQSDARKAGTP